MEAYTTEYMELEVQLDESVGELDEARTTFLGMKKTRR